jgi:hypothetical protein
LCREASRIGVLLIARVSGPVDDVVSEVRRLADYPAVGFAVLAPTGELDESIRRHARNMLLVQPAEAGQPVNVSRWAQVVICTADNPAACFETTAQVHVPVIVLRRLIAPATLSDARAACDVLQRDLAGRGEFAGYAV